MKRNYWFFGLVLFALLIAGGFFVCLNLMAAETTINYFSNSGTITDINWNQSDCTQGSVGGQGYIKMLKASSTIYSNNHPLAGYDKYILSFKVKTYGTTTGEFKKLVVSVYCAESNSTTTILEALPENENFQDFSIDLSAFADKNIKITFETPQARDNKGAGLSAIRTIGISVTPTTAIAVSSATEAEVGEEIIFDGSSSTADGGVIEWFWDFGDNQFAPTATTSHAFAAAGTYSVYLVIAGGAGVRATSTPLQITITNAVATTTATSNVTSTLGFSPLAIVINEIFPAGTPEWLELYNNTTSTINLTGWSLLDKYGDSWRITTFSEDIPANSFLVISNIAGNLNNGGDTLILKDPAGQIIDQQTYGDFSGKTEISWARSSDGAGVFMETITPTRGLANQITAKSSAGGGSNSYSASIKTAITTSTASVATSTFFDFSGLVVINEIFPNPSAGQDSEFIELKNLATTTLDLTGLILGDASKNKYVIRASSSSSTANLIDAGRFLVLRRSRTGIALNNTGWETVRLYNADLKLVDEVDYVGEKDQDMSYSRDDSGRWRWVKTPTPNGDNAGDELYPDQENNAILEAEALSENNLATSKKKKNSPVIINTILEELRNYHAGERVKVFGIVSVVPGVLSSQYFYLSSVSGGQVGVQVYCYKKDFPGLAIGDYLEVSGELSDTTAGRRLKISSRDQIRIVDRRPAPAAQPLATADIGDDYEGGLVSLKGDVLEISGRNLIIDDGSGEAKIYFNSHIDLKSLGVQPGDKLTVTGLVSRTASGYRVMPRDPGDIGVEKGEVKGAYESRPTEAGFKSLSWYLGALALFFLFLVAVLWWKLKNNH